MKCLLCKRKDLSLGPSAEEGATVGGGSGSVRDPVSKDVMWEAEAGNLCELQASLLEAVSSKLARAT